MRKIVGLFLLLVLSVPLIAEKRITSPEQAFGFKPGADRKLADWTELTAYFKKLSTESDRIRSVSAITSGQRGFGGESTGSSTTAQSGEAAGGKRKAASVPAAHASGEDAARGPQVPPEFKGGLGESGLNSNVLISQVPENVSQSSLCARRCLSLR